MIGPSELNGSPIHPLIVHIPVVFIPLAFIGAVAALARPRWRSWLLPLVAIFSGLSLVAIQLAVGSGRELEDRLGETDLIERHEHLALQTRWFALLFFLVAAGLLFADKRRDGAGGADGDGGGSSTPLGARLSSALLPLAVVAVVTGGLATVWVARTGDAGAKATWQGEIGYDQRGKGGGGDDAAGATTSTAAGDPTTTAAGGTSSGTGKEAVKIAGFAFGPKEITIKKGDSITWTNDDSAKHNAKSRKGPKSFTTKDLGKGDSDTVTFDEPGEYDYVCGFHTYMTGRIMVSG